jgi:hypothetical protein
MTWKEKKCAMDFGPPEQKTAPATVGDPAQFQASLEKRLRTGSGLLFTPAFTQQINAKTIKVIPHSLCT